MAGIGFELRKLFQHKGYLLNIRAYLYSTLVTVGPLLLCTIMITSLQLILVFLGISRHQREIFLAGTVYAFIFSQVITSGFSMLITRYISDRLYHKEYEEILASLYGVITLCLGIGGIIGIGFYIGSPLALPFKFAAYILYMELIILWLQSVYLSALKDYKKITKGFFYGMLTAVVLGAFILRYTDLEPALGLMVSIVIGVFIILLFLMFYIQSFFTIHSKRYFSFLVYFDRYPSLFFINLFYTLSLYIHNFIFWISDLRVGVGNTYMYAPLYDVPVFYALLSTLPAMVSFVVSVETSFYEKYRAYYSLITQGGNLNEIQRAKKEMKYVLWQEVIHLMEVQLFFTFLFMVIGIWVLPKVGVTGLSLDIYTLLTLGAYCNVMLMIVMLIQLYFEDRKGAFIIAVSFLGFNMIFTFLSLLVGESVYGLGFFLAAFMALIMGLIRLSRFLEDIDYHTFCSQPIVYKEREHLFSWIVKWLYR